MNDGFEDDDNDALSGVSNGPPRRKAHSYSQQLRTITGTHLKRHQIRKHSLDENLIPQNVDQYYGFSNNDFYPYATPATGPDSMPPPSTAFASDCHTDYPINQLSINPFDFGNESQTPLPEVVAAGGNVGIFRVPCRAALHPGRPPCLELRPHSLRETQVGRFLRTIACTETQLWAGQESGVRVWNFSNIAV